MSDSEILRHVLSVERDAASLEVEARDRAVEILRVVRAELAAAHETAVQALRKQLAADLADALERAREDQSAAMAAWQAALQAMPPDRASLAALVARLLAGGGP